MIYLYSHDLQFCRNIQSKFAARKFEIYDNDERLAAAMNQSLPEGILFDLRTGPRPARLIEKIFLEKPAVIVVTLLNESAMPDDNYSDTLIYWPFEIDAVMGNFDKIARDREIIAACDLVGRSPQLAEAARTVLKIAPSDLSVLVTGPSGAGKENIARAILKNSNNPRGPFIPVNVAALAPGIIESELFGHEKGSFTGAAARRIGLFEQASGGIIFLDEIGEIPIELQAKLLRVLENKTFTRVGGSIPIKADFRLIAATNRQLRDDAVSGRFREDLYYRLSVITIDLPPLQLRQPDISPLAYHFLQIRSRELEAKNLAIEPGAIRLFNRYEWPGNVRELKNVIDSFSITDPSGRIKADDFEKYVREKSSRASLLPVVTGRSTESAEHQLIIQAILALTNEVGNLKRLIETELNRIRTWEPDISIDAITAASGKIEDAEKDLINKALREANGNRRKAARILGIGERTLYRKLDKFGFK